LWIATKIAIKHAIMKSFLHSLYTAYNPETGDADQSGLNASGINRTDTTSPMPLKLLIKR
jgi:hypothetical protein